MRRKNDFYPTPEFATETLLRHVPIAGTIFEPCVGDHAIARILERRGKVITNDIDPSHDSWFQLDAAAPKSWTDHFHSLRSDWVVTNPPFNQAAHIVPLAYEHAREGAAMLLRLSYLEPVENRGTWLNEHPPTILIVLPRISFTGDGKTDNVTCAWMIWDKVVQLQSRVIIAENPRFAPVKIPTFVAPQEGLFVRKEANQTMNEEDVPTLLNHERVVNEVKDLARLTG